METALTLGSIKDDSKYSLTIRVLHWSMAAIIVGELAVGLYMTQLDGSAPNKYDLYPLHKEFGVLALLLLVWRIPSRLRTGAPDFPSSLTKSEVNLAKIGHISLYACMLLMTVSGYLMNSTYSGSDGIDFFGLMTFPDVTPKSELWNGIMHYVHTYTAYAFIAILCLHMAAVIKHRYFDSKDSDVLRRML